METDKRKQNGLIAKELSYFNPNQDWLKFASKYRAKYGFEFTMQILQWLKNDVKKTKQGTPLNELGKSAYPYLRRIFENPYLDRIREYVKKEHIKDLEYLGSLLTKDAENIIKEVEPEWVVKARKKYLYLKYKESKTTDDQREIFKIQNNFNKFGYK